MTGFAWAALGARGGASRIYFIPTAGALILLVSIVPVGAQGKKTKSVERPTQLKRAEAQETELGKLHADVVKTMAAYRESLEKLLAIYDRNLGSLSEKVELRRALYEKNFVSRRELEESERALADAKADVEGTRLRIAEADIAITEAMAQERLLKLPLLPEGGYSETAVLIRYNGSAKWSLADAAKIRKFFMDTFGRLLPVSAFGQTAVHERFRFDHRNAMDIAVHPDSSEGRALMAYFRNAGIPFVAFPNAVAGSSTGAHIHIGKPSPRNAPL